MSPYPEKPLTKKDWWSGSSDKEFLLMQALDPEFKPQYCPPKYINKNKE
jgi:hypothetical protein